MPTQDSIVVIFYLYIHLRTIVLITALICIVNLNMVLIQIATLTDNGHVSSNPHCLKGATAAARLGIAGLSV